MKMLKNLPVFTLVFMFSGVHSTVNAAVANPVDNCDLELPNPILEFKGTEDYEANGKQWTRYRLNVTNRASFPDELFRQAPDLPPCGSNDNASRTWVDIFESGQRIYGFCALSSADDLAGIWFAKPRGDGVPGPIHIQLHDRRCDSKYTSKRIQFDAPVVNIDCDLGFSLNGAIATVANNGTVNVEGTCLETQSIVIPESKNGISLVGPNTGDPAVVDGGGKNTPVLAIDGANQVTIKNMTFVNGKTGVLFNNRAGGRLINVIASDNTDGIVVDNRSHVSFDDVIASDNLSHGIKILNRARVRFMNLEAPENQCQDHEEEQSVSLRTFSLISDGINSRATALSSCTVVTENNGDAGVLVDGNFIATEKAAGMAALTLENCVLESRGQTFGLKIENSGSVTADGGILITENNVAGIWAWEESTLVLQSRPRSSRSGEIRSEIHSGSNSWAGIALIDSALVLLDASLVSITGNNVGAHQDGACVVQERLAQVNFSGNGSSETLSSRCAP